MSRATEQRGVPAITWTHLSEKRMNSHPSSEKPVSFCCKIVDFTRNATRDMSTPVRAYVLFNDTVNYYHRLALKFSTPCILQRFQFILQTSTRYLISSSDIPVCVVYNGKEVRNFASLHTNAFINEMTTCFGLQNWQRNQTGRYTAEVYILRERSRT